MSATVGFAKNLKEHPIDPMTFGMSYAWLEGNLTVELCRLEEMSGRWNDLSKWPSGRLFGSTGEYRWRSITGKDMHAVMILDTGKLPELFIGQRKIERTSLEDQHLILWGEWVKPKEDPEGNPNGGPKFYAGEIPEIQTYPLDGDTSLLADAAEKGRTPRLTVRRYRIAEPDEKPTADHADSKKKDIPEGDFIRCVGFDLRTEIEEK